MATYDVDVDETDLYFGEDEVQHEFHVFVYDNSFSFSDDVHNGSPASFAGDTFVFGESDSGIGTRYFIQEVINFLESKTVSLTPTRIYETIGFGEFAQIEIAFTTAAIQNTITFSEVASKSLTSSPYVKYVTSSITFSEAKTAEKTHPARQVILFAEGTCVAHDSSLHAADSILFTAFAYRRINSAGDPRNTPDSGITPGDGFKMTAVYRKRATDVIRFTERPQLVDEDGEPIQVSPCNPSSVTVVIFNWSHLTEADWRLLTESQWRHLTEV